MSEFDETTLNIIRYESLKSHWNNPNSKFRDQAIEVSTEPNNGYVAPKYYNKCCFIAISDGMQKIGINVSALELMHIANFVNLSTMIDTDKPGHREILNRVTQHFPQIQLQFFVGVSSANKWLTTQTPTCDPIGAGKNIIRILNKGAHFEYITSSPKLFIANVSGIAEKYERAVAEQKKIETKMAKPSETQRNDSNLLENLANLTLNGRPQIKCRDHNAKKQIGTHANEAHAKRQQEIETNEYRIVERSRALILQDPRVKKIELETKILEAETQKLQAETKKLQAEMEKLRAERALAKRLDEVKEKRQAERRSNEILAKRLQEAEAKRQAECRANETLAKRLQEAEEKRQIEHRGNEVLAKRLQEAETQRLQLVARKIQTDRAFAKQLEEAEAKKQADMQASLDLAMKLQEEFDREYIGLSVKQTTKLEPIEKPCIVHDKKYCEEFWKY